MARIGAYHVTGCPLFCDLLDDVRRIQTTVTNEGSANSPTTIPILLLCWCYFRNGKCIKEKEKGGVEWGIHTFNV
jgi:hypothetical protein